MNRRILLNFIKDKASLTFLFFLSSFLLILFFYLSVGNKVELVYPTTMSLFIYLILIIIEWIRYFKFNSNLSKGSENINYDLQPTTCEQKEVSALITEIHHKYINRINENNSLNKSQKHFLSQWIHNMKTPISVIDLILQKMTTDLSDFTDSTDYLNMIENIKEENNKLTSNLEQVLNILRLDDFSKDYVPEAIDLVSSVKKVINSKKNQFIYGKVFPKMQCDEEKVIVLSDSKWNEVMLEQIVANAIKYSQAGGESKSVYFNIYQEGNRTVLEIRDEGIGIPDCDIKRVFEPFFTGENGRITRNATGIGLYICSAISEKLGHEISIQSEVSKGTSVKITYRCRSSEFI